MFRIFLARSVWECRLVHDGGVPCYPRGCMANHSRGAEGVGACRPDIASAPAEKKQVVLRRKIKGMTEFFTNV